MLGIRTFRGAFCCGLALPGILVLLGGCSEIYLKPTAATGQAVSVTPQCPGPAEAMRFWPEHVPWVHVLVWVQQPVPSQPGTQLVIQLESNPSQGLSLWKGRHGDDRAEFTRRLALRYDVRVPSSNIVVTYADGRQAAYPSKYLSELRDAKSMNIQRSVGEIKIADGAIDDFSVELPPIYIDDERVVIAVIHFKRDKDTYMPVLNC